MRCPANKAGGASARRQTAVGTTRDAVHRASTTRARHTTRTPNPTSTADSRSGSAALLGASGLGLSQRSRLHLRRYFIPTSRLTSTYDTDTRVTRPRSTDKGTSLYMHRIYVYFTVISRADYLADCTRFPPDGFVVNSIYVRIHSQGGGFLSSTYSTNSVPHVTREVIPKVRRMATSMWQNRVPSSVTPEPRELQSADVFAIKSTAVQIRWGWGIGSLAVWLLAESALGRSRRWRLAPRDEVGRCAPAAAVGGRWPSRPAAQY